MEPVLVVAVAVVIVVGAISVVAVTRRQRRAPASPLPLAHQFADSPRDLVRKAMQSVDGLLEQQGWNLSASVWLLEPDVVDGKQVMGLLFAGNINEPVETALIGSYAPEEASVVMVAREVWAYPPGTPLDEVSVPATLHPSAIEQRYVHAMSPDGIHEILVRTRGESAKFIEEVSDHDPAVRLALSGKLSEALRVHCRAPSFTPLPTPRQGMMNLHIVALTNDTIDTIAEHTPDADDEAELGELLASFIAALVSEQDIEPDVLVAGRLGEVRELLPSPSMTWEQARIEAVVAATDDGDEERARFFNWVDDAGFAIHALDLGAANHGDVVLETIPEDLRDSVAGYLRTVGLRCTDRLDTPGA